MKEEFMTYEVSVHLVNVASNMRGLIVDIVGGDIWLDVYNETAHTLNEFEGGEGDTTRTWQFIIEDDYL